MKKTIYVHKYVNTPYMNGYFFYGDSKSESEDLVVIATVDIEFDENVDTRLAEIAAIEKGMDKAAKTHNLWIAQQMQRIQELKALEHHR